MEKYPLGSRVRSMSEGPLGVLDTSSARPTFLDDVWVMPGDEGTVVASSETMPDGWVLVSFDGKGLAPVAPDMIRAVTV